MLQKLSNARQTVEALFDEAIVDPQAGDVTIIWSGGLDNHPDVPVTLCDTVETAIDLWVKEATKWAGSRLADHMLIWRVPPEMQRWRITLENQVHLERFASERYCVYSVAAIVPCAPPPPEAEPAPEPSEDEES